MSGRRDEDRGLEAVARVREVRERDSRVGLARVIEEQRAQEARAEQLEEVVRRHAALSASANDVTMGDWAAQRSALQALGDVARGARDDATAAAILRTAADEHWRHDKTRLRAVETLLERRAEERRLETARGIARELDDISGQRWLRRRAEELE